MDQSLEWTQWASPWSGLNGPVPGVDSMDQSLEWTQCTSPWCGLGFHGPVPGVDLASVTHVDGAGAGGAGGNLSSPYWYPVMSVGACDARGSDTLFQGGEPK